MEMTLLIMVVTFGLSFLCFHAARESRPTKWEYKVGRFESGTASPDSVEEWLNTLAKDHGWEAVFMVGSTNPILIIFKRKRQ